MGRCHEVQGPKCWSTTGRHGRTDLDCDHDVVDAGTLGRLTTYYWQVRAINDAGLIEADGGLWRFTSGR